VETPSAQSSASPVYWIGVTDRGWAEFHASRASEEVNFWAPGGERTFRAIPEGGLFLFKLKAPVNKIIGGGWFVKSTTLPLELAWKVYGAGNGAESVAQLRSNITGMRARMGKQTGLNEVIGCTLLTECFWLPRSDWVDQPADWSGSIVQGKRMEPGEGEGARVWRDIQAWLTRNGPSTPSEPLERYGKPYLTHPRLGQAGFRVSVMDAYARRCAVTQEKTLPVLEAAHIRPYADGGGHEVANGLLLRSDFHTLFDAGYMTLDTDYRLLVSKRLREEFSNGKHYYAHHGQLVPNLPSNPRDRPNLQAIEERNRLWVG
jgi:putative restriction endonuclease